MKFVLLAVVFVALVSQGTRAASYFEGDYGFGASEANVNHRSNNEVGFRSATQNYASSPAAKNVETNTVTVGSRRTFPAYGSVVHDLLEPDNARSYRNVYDFAPVNHAHEVAVAEPVKLVERAQAISKKPALRDPHRAMLKLF
uniref:Uncharacterized protein n=1 Tax=Euplotes harpa TaxID=151035 RepID=A0A7S3N6N0_9SPIT|mmetsp:Transcript_16858/g.19500  ORF Transcript_16858/g.19500 Transcript_16858/m.19500 type:complete len:143 (-) Transcript_16858:36-464(-)